jgi:hypothetical protein
MEFPMMAGVIKRISLLNRIVKEYRLKEELATRCVLAASKSPALAPISDAANTKRINEKK